MNVVLVGMLGVLAFASLVAFAARRAREEHGVPTLESWTVADREYGPLVVWLLLGGTVYTAYTFAAVPGLVYGSGAIGFFALPYTIVVWSLAFWMLPRLWAVCSEHGFVTTADYVQGRWGSDALALAVALTGILATMPYVALQLLGVRAVLDVAGVQGDGLAADVVLTLTFGVLAVATFRSGLRAPAMIAVVKAALLAAVVVAVAVAVLGRIRGPAELFDRDPTGAVLSPSLHLAYATLAAGSAMALLCYPHVVTAALSARSAGALRRAVTWMPVWTGVLAVFALFGLAARRAGVTVPLGSAENAVPHLIADLVPAVATGVIFGALAVGALVPAGVMSVAVGAVFARNVYRAHLHPEATTVTETRVARITSLMVKVGALLFVLALGSQEAIGLQLLGGVWILQTFPAIALGLARSGLHSRAVLAGWAVGMASGTALVASGEFAATTQLSGIGWSASVYSAVVALVLNIAVVVVLTPLLDGAGIRRGIDVTAIPPGPSMPPVAGGPS